MSNEERTGKFEIKNTLDRINGRSDAIQDKAMLLEDKAIETVNKNRKKT